MKKLIRTGLLTGIAMLVVNVLLNPLFNAIFPNLQTAYETNPVFRPWEDPIMMLFFAYPIVLGLVFAWIWDKSKTLFAGSDLKKGLNFGLIFFFVSGLPGFIINYSSFKLPLVMILTWTIMSLVNGIVGGIVLAKLNK
ncbi:MAG: hypothetical protein GF347_03415 [Candidatus Moranbacteria bacterium]|nr:hypothetical protein [Candidatus Moranbacteria bacterium]